MQRFTILLTVLFILFQTFQPVSAEENHDELFVLIGDSLMKAKDGELAVVSSNMEQFAVDWKEMKKADSKQAKKVDQELKEVQSLLTKGNVENETLAKSLSSLSSAVVV